MSDLPLFDVHHSAPVVSASDVETLIAALKSHGWVTRAQLQCQGLSAWTERKFRAVAEASKGQIAGGDKGYALTRELPDDEADHVEARLISQANHMKQRAVDIRNARNRRAESAA